MGYFEQISADSAISDPPFWFELPAESRVITITQNNEIQLKSLTCSNIVH